MSKKILILGSRGGGGHVAVADSLKKILGAQHEVNTVVVMDHIFNMAFLNTITLGKFTTEDMYNFLLKRHWNRTIRWLVYYVAYFNSITRVYLVEKKFRKYLKKHKDSLPDLIISVTPYVNFGLVREAERWKIPVLILPTDLEGSLFLAQFQAPFEQYRFKVALAYDDLAVIESTAGVVKLPETHWRITGFPVRPACLAAYDHDQIREIRKKFLFPESDKVITLMMGALGGNSLLDHVKTLCRLSTKEPVTICVCTGHNQKILDKICCSLIKLGATREEGQFIFTQTIRFQVLKFSEDILERMAASDLIITKPGSCSVNEAIYLKKPVLLDNTPTSSARTLDWEKFNLSFVEKHQLGKRYAEVEELLHLIPEFLEQKALNPSFHCPDFAKNISQLVAEMMF
jgi:processive 1,2-diacylglycerol beta-glucosyltransferase